MSKKSTTSAPIAISIFVAGLVWGYSAVGDQCNLEYLLYLIILLLLGRTSDTRLLVLFALGSLLAWANPLSAPDDLYRALDSQQLYKVRVKKIVRLEPYAVIEARVVVPRSSCLLRLSLPSEMAMARVRGEALWVVLRVRPMISSANFPITNNYADWQHRRGLCASARVAKLWGEDDSLAGQNIVQRWRYRAARVIDSASMKRTALVKVLILGERFELPTTIRQHFAEVGLGHLLAISGLHVAIVTAFAYLLCAPLVWTGWQFAPALRSTLALVIAAIYAFGSGLDPPALRALTMLALVWLLRRWVCGVSVSSILLIFVFSAVIVHPRLAIHPSAQASVVAISLILLLLSLRWRVVNGECNARAHSMAWIWSIQQRLRLFILFHCALSLGMGWFFYLQSGVFNPVAPLANAIAVPLFTLVLPLAFIGVLLGIIGISTTVPFMLVDWGLDVIVMLANTLSSITVPVSWAGSAWPGFITLLGLLAIVARAFWMLIPLVLTAVLVLYTPQFSNDANRLREGDLRLFIIDVGQGSATLLETANHVVLIDSGARYKTGFDAGRHIINPLLRQRGKRPSLIVISHDDRDHSGGYDAVVALWGRALTLGPSYAPCRGQIMLDGVRIALYSMPRARIRNNSSCVVYVESHGKGVLLPADIEARAEYWLMLAGLPRVDWLIVPHHGSKTSSTEAFLAALQPRYAVVSRGLNNPYGHPAENVRQRYRHIGALWFDTACDGGVEVRFDKQGTTVRRGKKWQQSTVVAEYLGSKCGI